MARQAVYNRADYECARINIYICRALYNKMRKERYKDFSGMRAHEVLGINEKKMLRIFQCTGRTKLSDEEIENIRSMFNISADYFKKGSGQIINIGINKQDWTDVLDDKYNTNATYISNPNIPITRSKIKTNIMNIVDRSNDIGAVGDTLYKICYYYKYGETNSETVEKRIKQIADSLDIIKKNNMLEIRDLNAIEKDITSIEESIKSIRAVIDLKKIKILQ